MCFSVLSQRGPGSWEAHREKVPSSLGNGWATLGLIVCAAFPKVLVFDTLMPR